MLGHQVYSQPSPWLTECTTGNTELNHRAAESLGHSSNRNWDYTSEQMFLENTNSEKNPQTQKSLILCALFWIPGNVLNILWKAF